MEPFCYACGDQGGAVGERCGRDLADELGLSQPHPCRGYYGLPLPYAQASARARVETNLYPVRGGRYRWKHVDVLGRIVESEALPYSEAKAACEAWRRVRSAQLMGEQPPGGFTNLDGTAAPGPGGGATAGHPHARHTPALFGDQLVTIEAVERTVTSSDEREE